MKTPRLVARRPDAVLYECADCGLYRQGQISRAVMAMGPTAAGIAMAREDAMARAGRCRCELRGDTTDLELGMHVRRVRWWFGPREGIVIVRDTDDNKIQLTGSRWKWSAKNYRPEWA